MVSKWSVMSFALLVFFSVTIGISWVIISPYNYDLGLMIFCYSLAGIAMLGLFNGVAAIMRKWRGNSERDVWIEPK